MASSPQAEAGVVRDADHQFDYDAAVDDFLRDIPVNDADNGFPAAPAPAEAKDMDEEVKIRKKRLPVPKLDEDRLLSDAGVPKLRRIAKTKLRFKGKGHEFTDIARLLTTYQLWLDDLYPRAKFRDGLKMVEKVGHSKRMQVTRRAWLDQTKPSRREKSPERIEDTLMGGANGSADEARNGASEENEIAGGQNSNANDEPRRNQSDAPDDDDLDALLAESEQTAPAKPTASSQRKQRGPFEDDDEDDPDEDDLDALMAEQSATGGRAALAARPVDAPIPREPQNDFEDEEEIMAGMNW